MSNFIIPEKIRYLWGSHYTTPNWESRRNLSLPEFKRLREKQNHSKVIDQIENCVKWTCANFCMKKDKGKVTNPSLFTILEVFSNYFSAKFDVRKLHRYVSFQVCVTNCLKSHFPNYFDYFQIFVQKFNFGKNCHRTEFDFLKPIWQQILNLECQKFFSNFYQENGQNWNFCQEIGQNWKFSMFCMFNFG